jgi:hypothetical protein
MPRLGPMPKPSSSACSKSNFGPGGQRLGQLRSNGPEGPYFLAPLHDNELIGRHRGLPGRPHKDPKAFVWTASADGILEKVRPGRTALGRITSKC